jgi:predicted MFS family arabinose efflux permease
VRRLVPLVCLAFVLEAALYSALTPLLPHLAHTLGLSRAGAGVLTGAYAAGVIPGAALAGRLSSRVGPRAMILAGTTLLGVSSAAFGFGTELVELVATRALQGIAAGAVWGAALDWLTAVAPAAQRGRVIGITFGAATFGMIGGPVIGSISLLVGARATFGAVGLCALGLAAWTLTLAPAANIASQPVRLLEPYRDRTLAPKIGLVALQAAPVGLLGVLIPLRLNHLGAPQAIVGGTFLVAAAIGGVVSPLAGRVTDRYGSELPIRVGLTLAVPCLLALPLPSSTVLVVALTVAFLGLCRSVSVVPTVVLITHDAARAGVPAGVPAAILTASAIGETIGSAGGAGLAQATSEITPFVVIAALYALTLVLRARTSAGRGAGRAS